MKEFFLVVGASLVTLLLMFLVMRISKQGKKSNDMDGQLFRQELERQLSITRQELTRTINESITALGATLAQGQSQNGRLQDSRLGELNSQLNSRQESLQRTLNDRLATMELRLDSSSKQSEQKLENIRNSVENRLTSLQEDNSKKLELMRQTVDEKLQKTLDERLTQSFAQVSDRLEQVYKGLGEMQTLAIGVGDLKRVLSNVKTRGMLGEIQLGAILEQILSPEQYSSNVCTRKGSANVVEFAVKLPGDGETEVYLPIDAKFPADCYSNLMEAYELGDTEQIALCGKELEKRIKSSAKDIHDKYIDPPATTDFAIMFLPFEGLYAEVVRRGLIETLSRDYKINIAGPTTMAALLNSLQMGFKTLAIQKRSGEVWQVLGAVKSEFSKFSTVLEAAQGKLRKAGDDLDLLIGTRTKAIERKLRQVTELPSGEASNLLEIEEKLGIEDEESKL